MKSILSTAGLFLMTAGMANAGDIVVPESEADGTGAAILLALTLMVIASGSMLTTRNKTTPLDISADDVAEDSDL